MGARHPPRLTVLPLLSSTPLVTIRDVALEQTRARSKTGLDITVQAGAGDRRDIVVSFAASNIQPGIYNLQPRPGGTRLPLQVDREGRGWFDDYPSDHYLGSRVEGQLAGMAILGHPDNLPAPEPMRLNPTDPFFCHAPAQLGRFQIRPGTPHVAKYRFIVAAGGPDAKEIARIWADYADPPQVLTHRAPL